MKGQANFLLIAGIAVGVILLGASFSRLIFISSEIENATKDISVADLMEEAIYRAMSTGNGSFLVVSPEEVEIEGRGKSLIIRKGLEARIIDAGMPVERKTVRGRIVPITVGKKILLRMRDDVRKGIGISDKDWEILKYLHLIDGDFVEITVEDEERALEMAYEVARRGKKVAFVLKKGMNPKRFFFASYIIGPKGMEADVDIYHNREKHPCVTPDNFTIGGVLCDAYGKIVDENGPTDLLEEWNRAGKREGGGSEGNGEGGQQVGTGKCGHVVDFGIKYLDCPYAAETVLRYLKPEECQGTPGLTCAMFVWNTLYYTLGPDAVYYGHGRDICFTYPMAFRFTELSKLQPGDVFSAEIIKPDGSYTPYGHTGIYVGRGRVGKRIKKFCYLEYTPDPNGDYIFIHSYGSRDYQPHGVCFVPYREMFDGSPWSGVLRAFCRPKKCA